MKYALSNIMSKALLVMLISGTALAAETGGLQTETFQTIEEYQRAPEPYDGDLDSPSYNQFEGIEGVEAITPLAPNDENSHAADDHGVDHHNAAAHHGDTAHLGAHDAEHAEGHSGGLPQLDPTWFPSQLFWFFVTFGFLYMFFSRTVLPALAGTIETRRTQIDGDLETAEDMKKEAERVHDAYEEALDEARMKAHKILSDNENRLKEQNAERLNKLREKTAKDVEKTEGEIAKAKDKALKDIEKIVAEVSGEAAEKIVGIAADKKKVASVVKNINKEAA